MKSIMMIVIAAVGFSSGSVQADTQLEQREQPQWFQSGFRIVQPNDDCSAPDNQLVFATDVSGKLMACIGLHSKWFDAAPLVRMKYEASFSCGGGIPAC